MRWFTWKRVVSAAIIVVVVWAGYSWFKNRSKGPSYELVAPVKEEMVDLLSVSGKVDATKKAVLKFPTTGRIVYVGAVAGDQVKVGKLLLSIDTGNLQSAVTESFYRYQAADANAKLVEDQVKDHSGDETYTQKNDRVAAQTARDIAYDNWLEAKRVLKDSYIYAPFAGIVSDMTVDTVGASASITDGATVVDPTSLYFLTEVDENDLGKVAVGQIVHIDLDAFNQNIDGQVLSIGYQTTISDTGATVLPVKVKILSDEAIKLLRLGLNGDADIVLQTVPAALSLPLEAVKGDEVILADGSKRTVKTGIITDTKIQIIDGLSESDQVRLEK